MNNIKAISLMIGGGIMIALGIPTVFFAFIMYEEFEMYFGSFILVIGIILFKLGDNWLWREKPHEMY